MITLLLNKLSAFFQRFKKPIAWVGILWFIYSFLVAVPNQGGQFWFIIYGEIINLLCMFTLGAFAWRQTFFDNKVVAFICLVLWGNYCFITSKDIIGYWGHALLYTTVDLLFLFFLLAVFNIFYFPEAEHEEKKNKLA